MPSKTPRRKAGGSQTFIVTGDEEIDHFLRDLLPLRLQKKVLRQAMRAGAKVIAPAAKRDAPEDSGRTKDAIKVKAMKRSRSSFGINVMIGAGDYKGETFYAAMQEYGAKKTGSSHKGYVTALHFMGRAFDQEGPRAKAIAMKEILVGIEREASKPQ